MTELEKQKIKLDNLQQQINLLTKILTQISGTHNELVKNAKSQATVTLDNNARLGTLENFLTALQEGITDDLDPDKIIN